MKTLKHPFQQTAQNPSKPATAAKAATATKAAAAAAAAKEEKRPRYFGWYVAGGVLLMLLLLGSVVGFAEAATPSSGSCSHAFSSSGNSGAEVSVGGSSCGIGPPSDATTLAKFASGSSFTISCSHVFGGIGVPINPQTVEVRMYADNVGFPNGGGQFWGATHNGDCQSNPSWVVYCTSDGTATGAKRVGPVRLYVRIAATGVYNLNSDNGADPSAYGIFYCAAGLDSYAVESPPVKFIGGDVVRFTMGLTGELWTTSPAFGSMVFKCPSGSGDTRTNLNLAPTSQNVGAHLISGGVGSFPETCADTVSSFTITKGSVLMPSVPYTLWLNVPAHASISGDGKTVSHNLGIGIDRRLTPNGCSVDFPVSNLGDSIQVSCEWEHGRERAGGGQTYIPHRDFRAWLVDVEGASTSYSEMASFSVSSSGFASWQMNIKPDSALGSPFVYVEHISPSSQLYNWGSDITLTTDISDRWEFEGLNFTKGVSNDNSSLFIISLDELYIQAKGLKDIRGNYKAGHDIFCQRQKPNGDFEASVNMGVSTASGDSPVVQFSVTTPRGGWIVTCTATSGGNQASYAASIVLASAVSSGDEILVSVNATVEGNQTYRLNVTGVFRSFEPSCDCVLPIYPDNEVRLTLQEFTVSGYETVVSRVLMAMVGNDSIFNHTLWVSQDLNFPLLIYVTGNISAKPFISSDSFTGISSGSTGDYVENGYFNMTMGEFTSTYGHEVIPRSLGIPALLIGLCLAGVLVAFASKTNVIAPLVGMGGELITWLLANNFKADLGSMYMPILLIVVVAFLLLALIAFVRGGFFSPRPDY